jgi:hypothetical protein
LEAATLRRFQEDFDMHRLIAPLVAVITLAIPASVDAQARFGQFGNSPDSAAMRVQVNFQTVGTLAPAQSPEDQTASGAAIRQALYKSAAGECAVLSDVFKSDCKIVGLNVNSGVQNAGNGLQSINVTANATYELTPQPAPKAP